MLGLGSKSIVQTLGWSQGVCGMKLCSCTVGPWGSVKCLLKGWDEVAENSRNTHVGGANRNTTS